jgi:hypothetical protein
MNNSDKLAVIVMFVVSVSTTCTENLAESSHHDSSADVSSASGDTNPLNKPDSSRADGKYSTSRPTAKECRQFNSRETCLNAGCSKFELTRFGEIKNGRCRITQPETSRVCLVRENPDSTYDTASIAYTRKTSSSRREVMVTNHDLGPLLGGWKYCRDVFPDKPDCGCDF